MAWGFVINYLAFLSDKHLMFCTRVGSCSAWNRVCTKQMEIASSKCFDHLHWGLDKAVWSMWNESKNDWTPQ